MLGACQQAIPDKVRGVWTPVVISDCGSQGQTVEFASDGMFVTIQSVRNKIASIDNIKVNKDGTIDVIYRPIDSSSVNEEKFGKTLGMRFVSESENRLKLVAGSSNGVIFDRITDTRTINSFDLKKCGA
jgi:hypothetical protein